MQDNYIYLNKAELIRLKKQLDSVIENDCPVAIIHIKDEHFNVILIPVN